MFLFVPILLRIFILKWCWLLSNNFAVSVEMITSFLFFSMLMYCFTFVGFVCFKPTCLPGINPIWFCWMMYFGSILATTFKGFLHLCLSGLLTSSSPLLCLYLALVLYWCWLHRKGLEELPLFLLFGIDCRGLGYILLETFDRSKQPYIPGYFFGQI